MDGRRPGRWLAALGILALISSLQAAVPPPAQAESWVWMRRYSAAPGSNEEGFGVAAAGDGSVYVTGLTSIPGEPADLVLARYSTDGTPSWADVYSGPNWDSNRGRAVAVAADGSVYVAGTTFVHEQGAKALVLLLRKYSAAGGVVWTRTYGDMTKSHETEGVAVGRDGSVYVTGTTEVGGTAAAFLLKFSPSGSLLWSRTCRRTVGFVAYGTFGTGVAVDRSGAVYVAGYTNTGNGDVFLRKYSAAGTALWTRTFDGEAKWGDCGRGVAVGPDGVYVTGWTETLEHQARDLLLVKYSLYGGLLWSRTYDSAAHDWDEGRGVAVQRDGSVYVTGMATVAGAGGQNLLLRKYSPDGTALWTKMYNGGLVDGGSSVAVGPDGSVHVAGTTWAGAGYDLLLIKYK
jgi:uncharacterized delta-60 repeat protein